MTTVATTVGMTVATAGLAISNEAYKRLLAKFDNLNIYTILCVVFVLNIVDATLTLAWIDLGIAVEANPIMEYALNLGRGWFLAIKIVAIGASCAILASLRNYRSAKLVALLACCLYVALIVFHLAGASLAGISLL